jgi:hypothetical protein
MRTLKTLPFPLTVHCFDFNQVQVLPSSFEPVFFVGEEFEARSLCRHLFGRQLRCHEYALLCGCTPDFSEIAVGIDRKYLYMEFHDRELGCIGESLVYKGSDSRLILLDEHVRFLNQEKLENRKIRWFSKQKNACENLGIATVQLLAAKSTISQGYCHYPRMGFQAVLPLTFRSLFGPEYSALQTMHEILEIPEIWNLWVAQGTEVEAKFEIGTHSPSQLIFDRYWRAESGK